MSHTDTNIMMIMLMLSMITNVWLYKVNVKLDDKNRRLVAVNGMYSSYQGGLYD
jgi:hypothetical protein